MREGIVKLEKYLNSVITNNKEVRILDAGCGKRLNFEIKAPKYVIGIDISSKQLDRNTYLKKKIVGDIQTYKFPSSTFDLIICWDVLEHLSNPELALKNFSEYIKNNGLIVLKLPNVMSLKGLLTKFTPHKFHIFVWKYIYKFKVQTDKDDAGPFKTFLRFNISLKSLKKFAHQNKLSIVFIHSWDIYHKLKQTNKLIFIIYYPIYLLAKLLSFGHISDSEFAIVLKK